ncbi:hypothetical protein TWF281_006073 [Arthrobotrys megalospora]
MASDISPVSLPGPTPDILKNTKYQNLIPQPRSKLTSPLSLLPSELHIQILSYLTIADQIRASQTCILWHTLLAHTKSLQKSRYQPAGYHLPRGVRTHKLLALYNHKLLGKKSMPSGLLFRVENQQILEYLYYNRLDNKDCDGRFVYIRDQSVAFLDEKAFEPSTTGASVDTVLESDTVKANLFNKKRRFVYRMDWDRGYERGLPPTVRELLESIIVEAHSNLADDWGVYSDEGDLVESIKSGPNVLDEGCWLAAHLMTDLWTEDLSICLRRVSKSKKILVGGRVEKSGTVE